MSGLGSDIQARAGGNEGNDDKYGIVIDSGSSGSRIQIYRWKDPKAQMQSTKEATILQSLPSILQEKGWSKKISPGISSYNTKAKIKQIWSQHYSELMRFAESIIPVENRQDTPVFVLSTAGMRLLPKKTQEAILSETCSSIRKNTDFYLPDCDSFVQTIDGSTEGIYGWLGLNYLMGSFTNYNSKSATHDSVGFMDMGGASTQIAFVPSSAEQIESHKNDLSRVTLRNINGETQDWNVFVATWLGFGANEARKRYISQLISLASVNPGLQNHINDPCLPKGAVFDHVREGQKYVVEGVGNYEQCIKSIYPLLMKSIPCQDEPCLFNGIHGPKLDFTKDKFVGISEYWYTANDIFQSGGEYDFKGFNVKVKEYCESSWGKVLEQSKQGHYSGLSEDFLKDACFKASWVMNVLHEGFELPRIGFELDSDESQDENSKKIMSKHVPFKSADSVEGEELSWTLGKILLFASSQIEPAAKDKSQPVIGIFPSEISGHKFIPGGASKSGYTLDDDSDDEQDGALGHFIYSIIFFFLLAFFIYNFGKGHLGKWGNGLRRFEVPFELKRKIGSAASRVGFLRKYFGDRGAASYQQLEQINLEEGVGGVRTQQSPKQSSNSTSHSSTFLRTRSAIGLNDEYEAGAQRSAPPDYHDASSPKHFNPRVNNFLNKPFMSTKKSTFYPGGTNNSKESLRSPSGASITRSKSSLE
ncbi:uncharacterized protein LODBEIA_P50600 [Lodderomyces beijingensis]|uniref:Golgi apyrase n=1 Tax=Lodderomyces beijingensis TaxID=1775926 RepID=A0ABP0ZUN9_9ASCO